MFKRIALALTIPALLILSFAFFRKDDIHIAYIGPLSGPQESAGKEVLHGIQIYADYINANGGIKNQKVVIDQYDDEDNAEKAKEMAEKIAQDNLAIGVIGHISSDTASAAAPVYDKHKIPTLLPCATNTTLTEKHPTLFRTIFNDKAQSEYMCLYAKHLLNKKAGVLIYSETLFGQGLKYNIISYAKKIGFKITGIYNVQNIPNEIADNEVILLATSTNESLETIKKIRAQYSNPVVGPDSVAAIYSENPQEFDYEDVYATTPLLSELVGNNGERFGQVYKQEYKKNPGWRAFYGHDSAKTLLDNAKLHLHKKTLHSQRIAVIDTFNSGKAPAKVTAEDNTRLYGAITGQTTFKKQESNKDVQFGVLKANELIASSVQLVRIKHKHQIIDFADLITDGKIIQEKDKTAFYKTQIVASGVNINEVSALNIDKGHYMIDFYLWLRYNKNAPEAEDIIFLNAIPHIKLPSKISSDHQENSEDEKKKTDITYSKLIAIKEDKQTVYKLFRIKNIFRLDAFRNIRPPFYDITHTLGVNFRHTMLDKNFIRYAKDLTGKQDQIANLNSTEAMFEKTGWKPTALESYEDNMELAAMGNPHYLNTKEDIIFSRFNEKMTITDTMFSFFDFINYEWAQIILVASLALVALMEFIKIHRRKWSSWINIIEFIPYSGFIVSAQLIVMDYISHSDKLYEYKFGMNVIFDVVWWLLFASAFNTILQQLVWRRLEQRTGRPVPQLLYWCVSLVIYIFAIFGIIAFVLDMPITSLLASTSLLMFLVVMAIQMNVSNIFSGIFLNVEGKFREGDWVCIEDTEGWIVNTGWRTTSIRTERGNIVNIPNSKMAESNISNFNYPNNDYDLKIKFAISLSHQPDYVKDILKAAVQQDKDIKNIEIITKKFKGEALVYELTLTLENYADPVDDRTRDRMFTNIWHYLNKAGISPALRPSRTMMVHNVPNIHDVNVEALVTEAFKEAKADELKELINNARQVHIDANRTIDISKNVYIIGYGEVLKTEKKTKKNQDPYAAIGRGQIIGLLSAQNLADNIYDTLTTSILVKLDSELVLKAMTGNAKLKKTLHDLL